MIHSTLILNLLLNGCQQIFLILQYLIFPSDISLLFAEGQTA